MILTSGSRSFRVRSVEFIAVFATLGDLVEDVVVRVDDPLHVASDTAATIVRRRGGSAANVAEVIAASGRPVRFLGQVGSDPIGAALLADLSAAGVDIGFVRRAGRTGTIIVLVDALGERTMLTDRGACTQLDRPAERWLDGVSTLHVPMYSLAHDPIATTARTVIGWAHERSIDVSIDVSSLALIEQLGVDEVRRLLAALRPDVVFANGDEAVGLGIDGPIGDAVTVVKRGGAPAVVHAGASRYDVPAEPIDAVDTTGAGDAFAAGFLTSDWRTDVRAACGSAHRSAAATIAQRRT